MSPNPLSKGITVEFDLKGIVIESMNVKNLHIHVDWNGSTLYDEDHPQVNTYDSDYDFTASWMIPGFAPDGHYAINFKAVDETGKSNLCVNA